MKYQDAVKEFKELHKDLYENEVDYWTAQLSWATFVDGLCKSNVITTYQQSIWETPFPYGKHLKKPRLVY